MTPEAEIHRSKDFSKHSLVSDKKPLCLVCSQDFFGSIMVPLSNIRIPLGSKVMEQWTGEAGPIPLMC